MMSSTATPHDCSEYHPFLLQHADLCKVDHRCPISPGPEVKVFEGAANRGPIELLKLVQTSIMGGRNLNVSVDPNNIDDDAEEEEVSFRSPEEDRKVNIRKATLELKEVEAKKKALVHETQSEITSFDTQIIALQEKLQYPEGHQLELRSDRLSDSIHDES